MDGLEDQAEAESRHLIERLYTHETVEIKHSSRDSLMLRITDALLMMMGTPQSSIVMDSFFATNGTSTEQPFATRTLVFRSGLSTTSLARLHRALNQPQCPIQQLEFVCLRNENEIEMALQCARLEHCRIDRLRLENYRPAVRPSREDREALALTIRNGVFGDTIIIDEQASSTADGPLPHVRCFELVGFPLGTVGARILAEPAARNTTLDILRIMDCDLRSDSTVFVAQMIRGNKHLRELDLSYNQHYLASPLTREMTIKTLVAKGLKHNLTLQDLGMRQPDGSTIKRKKIDAQLAVNRFRKDFVDNKRDAFEIPTSAWPHVIARVSVKPSALHGFLRESAVALFGA